MLPLPLGGGGGGGPLKIGGGGGGALQNLMGGLKCCPKIPVKEFVAGKVAGYKTAIY